MQSVEADLGAMKTTPEAKLGDAPLPKRDNGRRGMLPLSWVGREVTVERLVDATGRADSHRGVLLDWCALGIVMNVSGARCVVPWERVGLVELSGE